MLYRNYSDFLNDISGSLNLSGYVPTSRTITINGTTYDLSANRTWTITTPFVSKLQHTVKAGVAINKGQAVYVTGADGTNIIVGLASNATEATSSKTMGLLDATVSTNGFANVVTEGLLDGLDTSTAGAAGDPVWLGTGGNLIYGLANKPYAPAHLVFIGIVTRKNANNGEIFVKVQNGFELKEIHDVDLITSAPTAGQLLRYESDGLWKNWSPNYLTAEADTLATVTGRGNSTTGEITVNGTTTIQNGGYLKFIAGSVGTTGFTVFNAAQNGYLSNRITTSDHARGWGWELTDNLPTTASPGVFFRIGYNGTASYLTSGNFGIGTTSPASKLQIGSVGSTGYGVSNGLAFGDGTRAGALNVDSNGTTLYSSTNLVFSPSTTEAVRITSAGNVGIGTSSPDTKLHVWNGDSGGAPYEATGITIESSGRAALNFLSGAGNDAYVFFGNSSSGNAGYVGYENTANRLVLRSTDYISLLDSTGEVIRIDNGNVGIGTTSPTHLLSLSRATQAAAYQLNINNAGGISDGNFTGIRFSQDSNAATELGNIKLHYYSTGATDLSFGTRYSPTALYIQSGGNVGIGTTTPAQKLDVVGTIRSQVTSPGAGNGDVYAFAIHEYNGNNGRLGLGLHDTGDAFLGLYSDGGVTTRIDSNGSSYFMGGNVGIGTTSPGWKLHVAGESYTSGVVRIGGTNPFYFEDYGGGWFMSDSTWVRTSNSKSVWVGGGLLGGDGGLTIGYGGTTPPSGGAIIAGNVGIGTSSPGAKLHVVGKSIFENNMRIYPASESWAEGLSFIMPTTVNWGGLRWQRQRGNSDGNWYIGFTALDSTDDLVFGANNGGSQVDNIIRLTKAGNVGIGTSAPTTKLDVRGNMLLKGDATDGGILTITRRYSTGAQTINFNNNHPSSNLDWTGARITSADSGQYNGYLDFAVSLGANGSEAAGTAAVASVMRLTKDGYVGIGTTTPSYKLHVNGTFGFAGSLYGDGKKAIDVYDSWLRLNQDGAFGSGVYTPYALRNDGAFDNYGGIYGYNTIRGRKAQTVNNYTTAALWTESYDNTTTGIAFHISGNVGKFLEMRTNGILYWDNAQVWTASTLTNLNQLTNGPGYITGYTETDTLNSVTSRGASTSNAITVGATTINGIWQTNISTAGGWSKLSFTASNAWGDGTTYGVLGAGGGNEPGVMVYNMHATWAGSGQGAGIRMGRSGGVSSGAWYQVATMDSDEFMIAKNGQWSNGGIKITSGGELQHGNSGNKYWHAGNDGSGSGLDADLLDGQNSTEFLRLLSGGAEASLDSYTDNGFRSVSFAGHSQHLLSWNASGSTGTVQQLFHYGVPNNGWRIRNKTDNSSWSDWGYVVMASSNQGLISGTIATQSWVGSQSYATTSYVTTQINNLIAGAPGALDTLDELAAALGDDSNFATTVTNSIAGKVSKSGDTMTSSGQQVLNIFHGAATGDFNDALFVKNTVSEQQVQIGMATTGSDGDHHRVSLRAYKGAQALEGVFGIALRQPGSAAHTQRLTLDYLGNLTIGGALTESSSIKLKENVETSEGNLEKVVNLRPVTYNKIGSQTTELGLIAEEVATVYPEFVQYDESGEPVGVNYSRLTAALIGAVKELTQRIETLENNG
jgi:hypothetical protein